jgi:hypothetical protein
MKVTYVIGILTVRDCVQKSATRAMEQGGEMVTTFLGFARHDMIPLTE